MPRKLPATLLLLSAICLAEDIDHLDPTTPREVQIRIARQSAPKEVGDHADIYVLTGRGYELSEHGDNGFACLITRQVSGTMEPECYDAEGVKTTLKVRLFVERQRAKSVGEDDIAREVKQRYKTGQFRPPSKPGIVYMLSDYNYVLNPETHQIIHFPGHLMFYAPYATEQTVGSGEGSPFLVHPGEPDALMIVVPASKAHH